MTPSSEIMLRTPKQGMSTVDSFYN